MVLPKIGNEISSGICNLYPFFVYFLEGKWVKMNNKTNHIFILFLLLRILGLKHESPIKCKQFSLELLRKRKDTVELKKNYTFKDHCCKIRVF